MSIRKCIRLTYRTIFNWRLYRNSNKKIKHLINNLKDKQRHQKYPIGSIEPIVTKYNLYHKSDNLWFDFYYSIHRKPDENLISVPTYSRIEGYLNDRMLTFAIKEKNFYDLFFTGIATPHTLIRRINAIYYNEKYKRIERDEILGSFNGFDKLILKPAINSGGGKSIMVFERTDGVHKSNNNRLEVDFLDNYSKDFVLQEFITQHQFFSQFNPTSNNTIRIFTYRSVKDDSINLLHTLLRIGAKGNFLDHDHLGGVVCAISDENYISEQAFDVLGNAYQQVNGIELASLEKVPFMDELRAMAKKIAERVFYGRVLAIDFTVTSEGIPLLLEINCRGNGVNQYQMHNGGLFKEFTTEILDHCQKESSKFVLNI